VISKVLVTGGAGFIGSHLTDKLVLLGYDVHILDNFFSGDPNRLRSRVTVHDFDIRDRVRVGELFSKNRFDVVFHEAAQMSVISSVKKPVMDATINIVGTLNLLDAGVNFGLKKFVFASSGGVVYGNPNIVPQSEDQVLDPVSPYGISKVVCETYLRYFWKTYGLSYIALRYSNVYGPRQTPKSGAGVIGIFCEKIIAGEQPLIFGSGNKTRDYVYVTDVIDANIKALRYHGVGSFNVGTGVETTVNEIFRLIIEYMSRDDILEVHVEDESGEQLRSVLDISKSKQLLGWQPTVLFEEGLRQTVDWYLSIHNVR
jgi:UDP-glucose 4-epimerase